MSTVTIFVSTTVSSPEGCSQTQESFPAESFAGCRKALSDLGKHLVAEGFKVTPDSRVDFTARKASFRSPSDWTSVEVAYIARYDTKPSKVVSGKSYTLKGAVAA